MKEWETNEDLERYRIIDRINQENYWTEQPNN